MELWSFILYLEAVGIDEIQRKKSVANSSLPDQASQLDCVPGFPK
jgi:hypothetical protein